MTGLRVTVCELPEFGATFAAVWRALGAHVAEHRSDLLLLPEMPFAPWLARARGGEDHEWRAAVASHDEWCARLHETTAGSVAGSRPILDGAARHNSGFVWTATSGLRQVHRKRFLPDEPGYWEASWYAPGTAPFSVFDIGGARAGMQICTDLWSLEDSRRLGQAGAQLILVPRATPLGSRDKWLAGGRVAGVVAGAYCASSNRADDGDGLFGGLGWVTDPEGNVLATTDSSRPFATVEIDLATADEAKATYPRYVRYGDQGGQSC